MYTTVDGNTYEPDVTPCHIAIGNVYANIGCYLNLRNMSGASLFY